MIDEARRRLHEKYDDDRRVRFEQMDAERLELEDGSFDLIISGFALTHIPQPELALREMYRVLRPGGRLAIALGSRPPSLTVDQFRHAVAGVGRKLAERQGRRITGELLDRIVARVLGHSEALPTGSPLSIRLNRAGLLRQLVRDAGFEDVERSWRNYQNEIGDVEEYWDLHRTIRSDVRKQLLLAAPSVVEQVREEFVTACRRAVEVGGVLASPISVVFVTAKKPAAP
jgi:ubiquinone/menaquinone biosynthesis C-methylase UbiE